jgi:hypothetical protein
MTQDEIIEMARQAGAVYSNDHAASLLDDEIIIFAKLIAQHERERIKAANAPEIERINAHIKKLEDAVLAEREACAKAVLAIANDDAGNPYKQALRIGAEAIRARGQA